MVECESLKNKLQSVNNQVLIDTWWNVNYERQKQIKRRLRFNRYMVECESVSKSARQMNCTSFNRYMVECESRMVTFV